MESRLVFASILRTIARIFLTFLLAGCLTAPESGADLPLRTYRDPSLGWTAAVPAAWTSCDVPGGQFTRGLPMSDPTKLLLWTYLDRPADSVLTELAEMGGVIDLAAIGERAAPALRWTRYRGGARSDPDLALEFAVATEGADTHLVLLVARRAEVDGLVNAVLLPAVDSFVAGPPDPPASVLAVAPPEPDYWPDVGWRMASPESQGMDGAQLEALIAFIRQEALPIDSVTVVRHGYMVLDVAFPPYQSGDLHELHSATKSVISALVGIALRDAQTAPDKTVPVDTPALESLSRWRVDRIDERKRAMTLEHLLTMTAGLAWKEWGAAYEPGTGNDLVTMVETAPDWTQYILDRPMAADPGTTFLYNSGASYLLSAVVGQLAGMPAAELAAGRLFAPLGIRTFDWPAGPEGVTMGWGNLRLVPEDLARIGLLYLHRGAWDGEQIVPADWVEESTTDRVPDPAYDYGYQWWLDVADTYAFMAGRFGQMAIVAPKQDMVIVITARLPDSVSGATSVPRWLAETFILPAAR